MDDNLDQLPEEFDEADVLKGDVWDRQSVAEQQLSEANRLIHRLSSALNALPNKRLPTNDGNFKDTYEAASAIDAYKRRYLKK